MKKLFCVLVMCFVLCFSSVAYADTPDEILYPSRLDSLTGKNFDESTDIVFEDGNCTSGIFYCEWSYDVYHADFYKFSGDHLYIIDNSTNERCSYSLYCGGKYSIEIYLYLVEDGNMRLYSSSTSENVTVSYGLSGRDAKMVKELFTTIPVFKAGNDAAISAYLNENDCSGASNYDDYLAGQTKPPFDEFDDEIPLPHNLRVLQGADQSVVGDASTTVGSFTKDVVISWDQADVVDDLTYEIQFLSYAKRMPDDMQLTLQEFHGVYTTIVTDSYKGTKTITVSIDVSTLNNYKEKGFLTKQKFRVRNVLNGHTSNWVVVTIDLEKGTATANEEGYADDTVDGGDEYNDSTVGGDTGLNVDGNVSIDGVIDYIRDGFGLLGKGGIISLMSSTFLYLPGSTWTIFNFFVSSLVVIAMIGAVVKIIF